ncbi:MAG: amino acid adenylation domain-containing protein [Spirochaetales bacterium]|nr:amino acid adenylation domain-containing protein [Spirochaetales bacterium]
MIAETRAELSPIQKQFWLQSQADSEGSAYNMASLFEITGPFDIDRGNLILCAMIQRHRIFRTVYKSGPDGFYSVVQDDCPVSFIVNEFSEESLLKDISIPFDLEKGPLFRAYYYPRKKGCYLLFVFHHIVIDLRSKDIFSREFCRLYDSGAKDIPLLPQSPQYEKYGEWLLELKQTEKWEKMKAFWKGEIEGNKPLLFSYDKERPSSQTTNGTRCAGAMSASIYSELHRYCHKKGRDPYIILLSAYYILLHKYTGQKRISVGVPRTNRTVEHFNETLGCFVNNLPMVVDIDPEMTISQLIWAVRKKMLLIHRNQYMPYTDIITLSPGYGDRKYNPLFQVGFTNEYPMELSFDNLTAEPLPVPGHGSQLDLFLYFWERNGVFHWEIEYNSDLFNNTRIESFIESYKATLKLILSGKDISIESLSVLHENMRERIIQKWNGTEFPLEDRRCLFHYFEEQARLYPDAEALIYRGKSLSFGELNRRANSLAQVLINNGVKQESIVGLSLERSFEMVVGLLGILKAGGAYCPMEPTHPDEYKSYLIQDAGLDIILTSHEYVDSLQSLKTGLKVFSLEDLPNENFNNPSVNVSLDNRCYVFYTSGSTGKPKGVDVLHEGVVDRILWMDRTFNFGKERKTLLKTPYNFDVSGMEFWLPLMTGAPLVISEPGGHLDNSYLKDVIIKENISIVHFVPSLLKTFLKLEMVEECASLEDVFCCGEALPADVVNEFYRIFPNVKLHNLYGPTEATIFITYWKCENNISVVPIGLPVSNTQVFIVDEQLNLLPPGIKGDLYLAGSGIARGYMNREELTSQMFIPQPWNSSKIMYKSGDVAEWTPEGELNFFGRSDTQVQLHGQRIELGEIENILNNHPAVEGSALTVSEDFGSGQRLAAFIVVKNEVTRQELAAHIGKSLPKYMIPSFFFYLDNFELSKNGKLDRKKLPDPRTLMGDVKTDIVMPETEMEKALAQIWEELLGCPVGKDNAFFELGGSSLQLMEMQQKLSSHLDKSIAITALFKHTVLSDLALFLSEGIEDNGSKKIASRVEKQKKITKKRRRIK